MKRNNFFILLPILLVMGCAGNIFIKEPQYIETNPTEIPILKIDTEMHTAPIQTISVDENEQFLVTGSDDKTAKLWDLKTGTAVKTFRIPVGNGNEGMIYAVAISPDSKTVAVGGYTGLDWDESAYIYLFDRESGALITRITDLPNVIHDLIFSPDGKYLGASLGASNGIRIFSAKNYSLLFEDLYYGNLTTSISFDSKGRVVTSSFDGYVRLYDSDFKLLAKKKLIGGKEPCSTAFSPDGKLIVVGFNDTKEINVISGLDLFHIKTLDSTDVNGSLSSVSFSKDGKYIYGGGMLESNFSGEWKYSIRKWDLGENIFFDIPISEGAIMDIATLKDGSLVFGGTAPDFGRFDSNGARVYIKKRETADFQNIQQYFSISHDGSIVKFSYDAGGKFSAIFNVQDKKFSPYQNKAVLYPAKIRSGILNITDWKDTYEPKLNGKRLPISKDEQSRSLAISTVASSFSFLLGTDNYLRHFDVNGVELWKVSAPGITWAVNISGDGKKGVAAFEDGTIRWYDMATGKELLALFPHADRKRWVLWTPEGYFDVSEGETEFVGYHINRGKSNEAQFIPIGSMYAGFYRPDLLLEKFAGKDISASGAISYSEYFLKFKVFSLARISNQTRICKRC